MMPSEMPVIAAVNASSPLVERDGNVIRFPARASGADVDADLLEVTVHYARRGSTSVLRYQTPGCGETIDLGTGWAFLGCDQGAVRVARPLENRVELSLATFSEGAGVEHTGIKLGEARPSVCILQDCARASAPGWMLLQSDGGHIVSIMTDALIAVESHQVTFEVTSGRLRLDTRRRGGGPYRADQLIHAELEGQVTYRNGSLLFAGSHDDWAVDTYPRLGSNEGTELEVIWHGAIAESDWTEVDGMYRRSRHPDLQLRFDRLAPDPAAPAARKAQPDLIAKMARMVEYVFKRTVRYLRPAGPLVELSRTETSIGRGMTMVKTKYRRQSDEQELRPLTSEIEVVGLLLDAERFRPTLRAPCRTEGAVATINGSTFKYAAGGGEVLSDAGLVVGGRLLARLRIDPWFSNLVVDRAGAAWIENAKEFYERGGLDDAIEALLQGTAYVRAGKNQRWEGDNPEVNWRSAVAISNGPGGARIILAHTLLPTTNLSALTAYGRGLTQFEMAEFLARLGADEALVLDGGPSAAFSIEGYLTSGGLREMPMCIAMVPRSPPAPETMP